MKRYSLFVLICAFFICLGHKGSADPLNQSDKYDVVVYGGTPAGIMAGIATARNGADVVIIEQKEHLGGMATSGLNTAESNHMINKAITGLAREFYVRMGKRYDYEKSKPAFFLRISYS